LSWSLLFSAIFKVKACVACYSYRSVLDRSRGWHIHVLFSMFLRHFFSSASWDVRRVQRHAMHCCNFPLRFFFFWTERGLEGSETASLPVTQLQKSPPKKKITN
jgi:hypothetical protein